MVEIKIAASAGSHRIGATAQGNVWPSRGRYFNLLNPIFILTLVLDKCVTHFNDVFLYRMWCVHQLIQLSVTVYIGVDGRYQEWLQKNKVQHVHSEGEGEMEHAHNRHNRFGQLHSFCTHVPPSIHKSNYNCLAAAAVPTVIACSHLLAAALCYSAPVWALLPQTGLVNTQVELHHAAHLYRPLLWLPVLVDIEPPVMWSKAVTDIMIHDSWAIYSEILNLSTIYDWHPRNHYGKNCSQPTSKAIGRKTGSRLRQ